MKFKNINTLIFFLILNIIFSQYCNDINEYDNVTTQDLSPNYLYGQRIILENSAYMDYFNIISNYNASGQRFRLALYSDLNSQPYQLILWTTIHSMNQTGLTQIPVSPTYLPANQYWIMLIVENAISLGSCFLANQCTEQETYYIPWNFSDFIPYTIVNPYSEISGGFSYFITVDCLCSELTGDINHDANIDVFDIIVTVSNCILNDGDLVNNNCNYCSDLNNDQVTDILDLIILIDIILD